RSVSGADVQGDRGAESVSRTLGSIRRATLLQHTQLPLARRAEPRGKPAEILMTVYRGITHVHSTYSFDGTMSLPEIRTLCQGAGYSFALMSEHIEGMSSDGFAAFLRECRAHSDDAFLFVPGLEFHAECVSTNGLNEPVDMGYDRRRLLEECLKQDTFNVFVH